MMRTVGTAKCLMSRRRCVDRPGHSPAWCCFAPRRPRRQDWARKMFDDTTTHDFGVVARGAKAEHRFVIENIYEEDAHIKSVTSSCQCSKPQRHQATAEDVGEGRNRRDAGHPGRAGPKGRHDRGRLRSALSGQGSASRPQLHPRRRRGAAGRGRSSARSIKGPGRAAS